MSVIVALSGGKASAWCAGWALVNYPKEDVVLYFNDTKWEHPDLYRFIDDLSVYFSHKITVDSDGRSPEDLFYDNKAIANNRMPFCSRILKAERLQKFYKDGDTIIFGIDSQESHRAMRICLVYEKVMDKTGKSVKLRFPLIEENITKDVIDKYIDSCGIKPPILYSLGFSHNNCSGGCVRAGKKQWKMLYERLPDVYLDRERVEQEVSEYLGKRVTIFRDESLKEFRGRIENNELSAYYSDDTKQEECIGICQTES